MATDDGVSLKEHLMKAEKISCGERMELKCYKCITYFPVMVTFGLFATLVFFYSFCYLRPVLLGDFEGTLGITEYWANDDDKEKDRFWTQIYLGVFIFCCLSLFIAIILTITTSPGHIPSDKEWDMPEKIDLALNKENKN